MPAHSSPRPPLRRPLWVGACSLLLAGLLVAGWLMRPAAEAAGAAPAAAATSALPAIAASQPAAAGPGMLSGAPQAAAPAPRGPMLDPTTLAFKPAPRAMFRTNAQGALVHDEHTRVQMERLLALHSPDELTQRLAEETAGLPATAAAQARELVQRYEAYQAAQRQAYAPGVAPLVPEEALVQLQTLQAMRASHFGAEAAKALFGEEEAVTRRLLQLMQQETDTRMGMAEKAQRAQVRFDQERGAGRP